MPCTILIIKYLLKFYEILNKVDIIARLIIYCFTLHKHLWDFNPCLHFVFKNIIILYIYRILNYQLIIREMVSSSTSQNPMNKWRVDLSGSSGGSRALIKSAASDQTLNPPGYSPGFVASQKVEAASKTEQQQQHLIGKRAWEIALGPLKALPMNMFMMYMAGNTISIFPIMMVVMMAWRPIKALLSVNAAFKPLEQEHAGTLLLHKLIFALGNLAAIVLAVYKCHTMGLLPSHESDWLDFMPIPERMQYALFSAFPTD